jgi:phage terminase Nu1 subunit (DNA packaging protein)
VATELLTREPLAERFGVDVRTITNWVAEGMPQRTRSGKVVYSWPECLKWREQRIRDDARATRFAEGDEDKKKQMADARLRTALAEADQAELDLAARRGELVPVAFMREEFDRIAMALRARLLSMPAAWASRLGTCQTTVDRQLALTEAVNELMPILRELADDDGEPSATTEAA